MSDQWDGVERRRDTSESIAGLAGAVEGLSSQVSGLRDQIATVDTKRKRSLLWLIPIILFIVYVGYEQRRFENISTKADKQALALSVGVCAMQNVIRIEIGNFLAEAQNRRVFDEPGDSSLALQATAQRQAFLTEARKHFELAPCEALVAGENVTIRLEYPPTIPVTSVP